LKPDGYDPVVCLCLQTRYFLLVQLGPALQGGLCIRAQWPRKCTWKISRTWGKACRGGGYVNSKATSNGRT